MDLLAVLRSGPLHSFADWPSAVVPPVAAGVYSIWDRDDRLIYVGMSGRGRSAERLAAETQGGVRRGLWTRLDSHASGRRSGDQFNVYVADRLVLAALTAEQIAGISRGELHLDRIVREWIRAHLAYRFALTADGDQALAVEKECRLGALGELPLLNPAGRGR